MSADFSGVGLAVGHATDERGITGLTVFRGVDGPLRGAACVFGRASGNRELEALKPGHIANRVDAVLLTGGAAFGLDAAAGVMRWLEERGLGFEVGVGVVPIVPAAVIFDLAVGSPTARPTADMAYAACADANTRDIEEGSVGAGTGATVGKGAGRSHAMKGGFGCAYLSVGDVRVCAAAVVNSLGDVRGDDGQILAGARDRDGTFFDTRRLIVEGAASLGFVEAANTTLCVVAANVSLTPMELHQLARSAGSALFRRITPAGTAYDGDTVFALSRPDGITAHLAQVESVASQALEVAIERGVTTARSRAGVPGLAGP